MTEDEMAGWHHRLGGHEFERALGVGDGQGGLVCSSPWGHKESDRLSDGTELIIFIKAFTMAGVASSSQVQLSGQDKHWAPVTGTAGRASAERPYKGRSTALSTSLAQGRRAGRREQRGAQGRHLGLGPPRLPRRKILGLGDACSP